MEDIFWDPVKMDLRVVTVVKNPPANARDMTSIKSLGGEDWRAWQPTPVFLPGESPWTEEPGGLQSIGSQNVSHN